MPICGHNQRMRITWNDNEERYETTTCRPFPSAFPSGVKGSIAMCDPYRGTCKKEQCTFAHGRTEQKAWNSVLRQQREQEGKLANSNYTGSCIFW